MHFLCFFFIFSRSTQSFSIYLGSAGVLYTHLLACINFTYFQPVPFYIFIQVSVLACINLWFWLV